MTSTGETSCGVPLRDLRSPRAGGRQDGSELLLVAATVTELAPLLGSTSPRVPAGTVLNVSSGSLPPADVLITGVGQLQCAVHLARTLARRRAQPYTCVVQAGIAGSFSAQPGKGAVVAVEAEALADLGAESASGPLDLSDLGLLLPDSPPFRGGWLHAARHHLPSSLDLPWVRSVTVNRVLSNPESIAWVRSRYAPDVVNMEGAALFYTCLIEQIPFISLRAISDVVGPRDTSTWDIPGAVSSLCAVVEQVLRAHGLSSTTSAEPPPSS